MDHVVIGSHIKKSEKNGKTNTGSALVTFSDIKRKKDMENPEGLKVKFTLVFESIGSVDNFMDNLSKLRGRMLADGIPN